MAESIVQMKVARGFFCFRSRFWGGEPGLEVEDRILIRDLRRRSLGMGGCALFPVSQGVIERFEPWRYALKVAEHSLFLLKASEEQWEKKIVLTQKVTF